MTNILSQVLKNEDILSIKKEFSRLGERCYLENAGATLYPQILIENVTKDLLSNIYMNPHSDKSTKDVISQIRYLILRHFGTDPSEYSVIFTSGTTQSLKLVAESFQFSYDDETCGTFVYLRDNHTSVLGLRELAEGKGADIIHISHDDFINCLKTKQSNSVKNGHVKDCGNTLFVYPAESNFNGFKYPMDCVDKIKNGCINNYIKRNLCKVNNNWYVLLDSACYVATNSLDLSKNKPDFVCISFYKMFGFPTGLGALIVRNKTADVLSEKRYYGGGTVDIVLSTEDFHVKRKDLNERFEDGTVPFLSIIALKHCFQVMHSLIPKIVNNNVMDTISYHTFYLAKDLYHQLKILRHHNGREAAILYMDTDFTDVRTQGGIVAFNLVRDDGSYIGYAEFQKMADLFGISVRTGCFCNSGSCQRMLKISNQEMKDMFKGGHKCGDELDLIDGKPTGAVRVSFAYYNTFADVDKLMAMITRYFVKTNIQSPIRESVTICMNNFNNNIQTKKIKPKYEFVRNAKFPLPPTFDSKIFVKEIAIFPIKSCGAFKITSNWKIGSKGFEYDREWMIVKDNGTCLTQKQNTRMCMIKPILDLKNYTMVLHFPDKCPIEVPLEIEDEKTYFETSLCHSKVCSDYVKILDCGDAVGDWISEALEISYLRLVKQPSNSKRRQKKKGDTDGKLLSLSNQAQFLLINMATVRWLVNNIKDASFVENIDDLTDRFRGNIIIDMDQELVESDWQRIIIGKHEFKVEGLCPRCQMVCIHQKTGEKTVEPLRTISEQFEGKIKFGIYLTYMGPVDRSQDYTLKVGSKLKVMEPLNIEDANRFTDSLCKIIVCNYACTSSESDLGYCTKT